MSLLTEKQIKEILLIIENEVNVEWPDTMLEMLCEWNEKQPSAQYAPDWDTAPEKAVQAVVNSFWVDKNGDTFGVYKTYYERPAPVIVPHPHAEMMAKYAEVAARRSDPWVEFERYNYLNNTWEDKLDNHPSWRPKARYRHIGDAK